MRNLTLGGKIAYSSGNLGKSVVWSTLEYFFLFFMTEFWGVPPVQAGAIILLTLLWDGFCDPILGFLVERTHTRLGRYGPYLIFGPPACALSFVLLFIRPGWSPEAMVWYAVASGILFRTCYAICDVPHNALMARISANSRDASLISGLRYFFSAAGALLVSFAVTVLFAANSESQKSHFLQLAMVCGGIYAAALWLSWFAIRPMDRNYAEDAEPLRLRQAVKIIAANDQFLLLLLLALCQAASVPIFAKCIAYYAKYVVGDQSWTGLALMVFTSMQAISMVFWTIFVRRFDKRTALFVAYGLMAAGLGSFAAANLFGGSELFALTVVGVAVGGINMVIWALLPDVVSHGVAVTGRRIEALSTSLFLLVTKVGVGLSAAFTGLAFAAAGFVPSAPPPDRFAQALVAITCTLPLLGIVLCAAIAYRIRLRHCEYSAAYVAT